VWLRRFLAKVASFSFFQSFAFDFQYRIFGHATAVFSKENQQIFGSTGFCFNSRLPPLGMFLEFAFSSCRQEGRNLHAFLQ